jgi:hypothetical protein
MPYDLILSNWYQAVMLLRIAIQAKPENGHADAHKTGDDEGEAPVPGHREPDHQGWATMAPTELPVLNQPVATERSCWSGLGSR